MSSQEQALLMVGQSGALVPCNFTCSSGPTWTATTQLAVPSHSVNSLVYGNGVFVMGGITAANTAQWQYSADGVTWALSNAITGTSGYGARGCAYGNGIFLSGINASLCATSVDGITWTSHIPPTIGSLSTSPICYSPTLGLFSIPSSGGAFTTTDGITFTSGGTNTVGSAMIWIPDFGGRFILSNTFAPYYSTDGLNFTVATTIPSLWVSGTYAAALAYGANVLVGLINGSSQNTYTSIDGGVTWVMNVSVLPSYATWHAIVFFQNVFVAISTGSAVAVSTDGFTWTASPNSLPNTGQNLLTTNGTNKYVTAIVGSGVTAGNVGTCGTGLPCYSINGTDFPSGSTATTAQGTLTVASPWAKLSGTQLASAQNVVGYTNIPKSPAPVFSGTSAASAQGHLSVPAYPSLHSYTKTNLYAYGGNAGAQEAYLELAFLPNGTWSMYGNDAYTVFADISGTWIDTSQTNYAIAPISGQYYAVITKITNPGRITTISLPSSMSSNVVVDITGLLYGSTNFAFQVSILPKSTNPRYGEVGYVGTFYFAGTLDPGTSSGG